MVVMFSKFLPGQRDSQLLLDSDNFTYSRKKDKDTPLNTAWRCSKNRSLFSSLKRKAADQRITATQNIVSEVLEGASKDLNKKLPNIHSISRVVQRSRAQSSGCI